MRDRDVASDMAQESFARVYAAERSGTVVHDPRALLYTTARNLLTDQFRRGQAGGQSVVTDVGDDAVELDNFAGPQQFEPEYALASRQRFEMIAAVVDSLPPRCR